MVEIGGAASPHGWRYYVLRLDPELIKGLIGHLTSRIIHMVPFGTGTWRYDKSESMGPEDVGKCRRVLLNSKIFSEPKLVTMRGTFLPSVLLSSGWWERHKRAKSNKLNWREPLQEWLFKGFEEWGPSWDISFSVETKPTGHLFCQLGDGDEVNSLPVVVRGEKAKKVRQNLLGDQIVFEAEVTGLLCHRSHLSEAELKYLGRWGKAFDYCILVSDEEKQHAISRRMDRSEAYSGYLWQCIAPANWLQENRIPRLDEAYFIWEHTDFTKPDAIAYNLDSLQHKAEYLRLRYGNLVLLQKSSVLVPGEPQCSTAQFYRLLTTLARER